MTSWGKYVVKRESFAPTICRKHYLMSHIHSTALCFVWGLNRGLTSTWLDMFNEGMETASLPGKGRCSFIVIQCVGWFSLYCSCQSSGYRWKMGREYKWFWEGKLSDSDPLIWQALPKKRLAVMKNWFVWFLVKYPSYRCVAEMADKLVKPESRSLTCLVT